MSRDAIVWLAFVFGGVITFLQRASFVLFVTTFSGGRSLPAPIERALGYVAPAAFAAIVAPRVFDGTGASVAMAVDARLLAAVVGAAVMWKVKRLPVMLVVGMVVFWLLRAIGL